MTAFYYEDFKKCMEEWDNLLSSIPQEWHDKVTEAVKENEPEHANYYSVITQLQNEIPNFMNHYIEAREQLYSHLVLSFLALLTLTHKVKIIDKKIEETITFLEEKKPCK